MMSSSQIYYFSSTRVFKRSMPVSKSSMLSFSMYSSMWSKSLVQFQPILVRELKMSTRFRLTSRSILDSNICRKSSAMLDSWMACKFLQSIAKFLIMRVMVLRSQSFFKSVIGSRLRMKLQIDSMTLGYCMKRKGASVLTLQRRRVLREKLISLGSLDWNPRMSRFTSGMEGYILVLLIKFTIVFLSIFQQYLFNSVARELLSIILSPYFVMQLMVQPPSSPPRMPVMGFLVLPATSQGRSAPSSLPKQCFCSQPSKYFWQWFLRVKLAEVQVEGSPNSSTISFHILLCETASPPPFLQTDLYNLKRLSSLPPIWGILICVMPLDAQYSQSCFLNFEASSNQLKPECIFNANKLNKRPGLNTIISNPTYLFISIIQIKKQLPMNPNTDPYIDYFQTLFPQHALPRTTEDFIDGLRFADVLAKIPDFPPLNLEHNPTTFSHVFSNLKELYKKIESYWNETLDREIQCEEIDLVEIAHNRNEAEIKKIFSLVVQTLVMSSERDFFVQKILQTSVITQQHFMVLVEKTLEVRKTFSPRKQREQRLYDKMVELDHENENLQNVISELCLQKQEMQNKYNQIKDRVEEKESEVKKLNEAMTQFMETPKKGKYEPNHFDTKEKNKEFVEKLKQKILEMTKEHEKQTLQLKQQIQFCSMKLERLEYLENQIEGYKVRFEASKEALQHYEELHKNFSEAKLQLMEKEEKIEQISRKLSVKNKKIQDLEERMIEKDLQIERKKVQLQENNGCVSRYTFDEPLDTFSAISLHKSLSDHCPEIMNSQSEHLYESNRKLREELERAASTIKEKETELEKLRKHCQILEGMEAQNRKLTEMIEQISEHHEEEKYLILGCMHELRSRFQEEKGERRKEEIKKLVSKPLQRKRTKV